MIKYDNKYYEKIMKNYKYDKIQPFLSVDKFNAEKNWLCSYNLNDFINGNQKNEKCLIIMGIGINGVPHLGTVSQMLKAIYLQKCGFNVQIILGDLDVYGARSTSLKKVNKLVKKYKQFIVSLGFDEQKGEIRDQFNHPEILKTSFILSSVIRDRDFDEIEEEINELYKTERVYEGMDYNVKQAISLMFADFIHPGFVDDYKHVLIISGIDEHGYVWKANEIRKRMDIDMTISGLYSKMLRGLNEYPKMSKSILNSNIDLSISKASLKKILISEKNNYKDSSDCFVYQLMTNISLYDEQYLKKIKSDCLNKDQEWDIDVDKYIEDLYKLCCLWR